MEAVNGASLGQDKGAPPPPSPLTGCYLLVVIGEPHSADHKDIILQKVAKGLLSWDVTDCLVDLEKELAIIIEQGLEGEEARFGERLIQFASENLVTEILIHPAVSTLSQCVRNLLSSFTRHRHIIHAGYTFQANGSWALQDGTFSYSDFVEAFQEIEVQRVIHAYENGISIDLHCSAEGDWARLSKEYFTKSCKVRVNPTDVLTTGSPSISRFIKYLDPFLVPTVLEDILESSDVVGNIRFSRPTLYVFPGGQGDAALFGINGFNMLLDGGYSRKACFWDFVRHLDRLDAVLMTRLNNSSVNGVSSVLERKKQGAVYPQIGHFFCNIQERKSLPSPDGDKDKDPLIISLLDEGQNIIQDLRHLNLSPQVCYRDSDPIILYHKVGHGTLNMYVLSPDKNSREVREFLQKWNQSDPKLFAASKPGKEFSFPLQNLVSICALLVWQPANPSDTITRILYPGSTPQKKIFEGLDRLKNLDCMKHPICSVRSIIPVKKTKQDVLEKMTKPALITDKKIENKPLIEDSIKKEMNGDVVREKQVAKSDSLDSDKEKKVKKIEDVRKSEKVDQQRDAQENGEKAKAKPKAAEPKPKAKEESQLKKKAPVEKKGPPTPKKTIENKKNGDTKEKERKAPQKPSPQATPAKSTKDANNRKVIENKKALPKKEAAPKPTPAAEPKPKPERKPISRRPKTAKGPPSPMKKMTNGVQKPDSLSKRGKLDKEGTTDSSTVSTPSADQESILKKDISKLTPEELQQLKDKELEELKEEQDAIKEIEAVFRKGEAETDQSEPGVRKIKEISIDDHLDTEEYLIIEKEDVEHDSLDQEAKEDEMQKLVRDSEESEKPRKLSSEDNLKADTDEGKAKVTESQHQAIMSPDDKPHSTEKKELHEEEVKETVDEKVSANVESGATTTAPTLPEDERLTLDEIKEDNGQPIEEKHIKEETKEKGLPIIQLPPKSQQDSHPKQPLAGIQLDKQKHVRDIVKTPDEVADLPVHEEADYQEFDGDDKKTNEVVASKPKEDHTKQESVEKAQVDETGKLTESVIEHASVAMEKCDILEKAEVETKEKSDQDNNLVLHQGHINESMEDEWVVITKGGDAASKLIDTTVKVLEETEDLKQALVDKVISDAIEKELDSETEVNSHEVRKEDEVEGIVESDKEDITALIEEADRKSLGDDISKKASVDLGAAKQGITAPEDASKELPKVEEKPAVAKDEVKVEKSTRSPEHAESVILTDSSPEDEEHDIFKDLDIDKAELGRKSPAEREEDVKKIVVSVAEVLKSEAPLEEFQGKLPFTQELRETHITTQDSPILEAKIIKSDDIPPIPEEADEAKSKASAELSDDASDKEDDAGVVHRMLVTASSEDGGEEIEICPAGTITFSKSSESSGRSSPEASQKTQSQKSSIVETLTDTASTAKQITELETATKIQKEDEKKAVEAASTKLSDEQMQHVAQLVHEIELQRQSEPGLDDVKTSSLDSKIATEAAAASDAQGEGREASTSQKLKQELPDPTSKPQENLVSSPDRKVSGVQPKELADSSLDSTILPIPAQEESKESPKEKEVILDSSPGPKSDSSPTHKESPSIEPKGPPLDSKLEVQEKSSSVLPTELSHSISTHTAEEPIANKEAAKKQEAQSDQQERKEISESGSALKDATSSTPHEIEKKPSTLQTDKLTEPSLDIQAQSSPASSASTSPEPKLHETQKESGKDVDQSTSFETALGADKESTPKDTAAIPLEGEKAHSKIEHVVKQDLEFHEEKGAATIKSHEPVADKATDSKYIADATLDQGKKALEKTKEESEADLEGVLTSISKQAHSILDGIIKSDTDSSGKGDAIVDVPGKASPSKDAQPTVTSQDPIKEERRSSIIESAEDFLEKTEKTLESVFSAVEEGGKSLLERILPDTKQKTEENAEKSAFKGKDIEATVQDSHPADKEHEELPLERKSSLLESAEIVVEKSEKALESMLSSVGEGAKPPLQDVLPKAEAEAEKTKAENIKGQPKDPQHEDLEIKSLSEKSGSFSETAEEFIEKAEKALGSAFSSTEEGGKFLLRSILPDEKPKADVSTTQSKSLGTAKDQDPETLKDQPGLLEKDEPVIEVANELVEKMEKSDIAIKQDEKLQSAGDGEKTKTEATAAGPKPADKIIEEKTQDQRRGSIIESAEEFVQKSEKALESMFSAIGDGAKSLLQDILPGEKPKADEVAGKPSTEAPIAKLLDENIKDSDHKEHDEVLKNEADLLEKKPSILEPAEALVKKSEKALESMFSSIGDEAKTLLHDSLQEVTLKYDKVTGKPSDTDSKSLGEDIEEKPHDGHKSHTQHEEPLKKKDALSERRSSIIDAAEEIVEKSEKALESVFAAIGEGAKSLLQDTLPDDKLKDDKLAETGSKSSAEDIEEKLHDVHELHTQIGEPLKKQADLPARRSSVIDAAEELVEKSEKAVESVFAAIGEGAKSLLHHTLPEDKLKDDQVADTGSKSSGEDIEEKPLVGHESQLEEHLKKQTDLPERRSSIIDEAKEIVEKSEQTMESVFAAIGEGAKSLLHQTLPDDKLKDDKVADKGSKSSADGIEERLHDGHELLTQQEEPLKKQADLPERRSSIIDTAEEVLEKSEKAIESVFAAIGEGAKSLLHHSLPEDKLKDDKVADTGSKSSGKDIEEKLQCGHKSLTQHEETFNKQADLPERRSSIIDAAEELVEQSEKAIESVFAAIGEGAKLPDVKLKDDKVADTGSKSSGEDIEEKPRDGHESQIPHEEPIKKQADLSERRSSIIDTAEDLVEKSEKAIESVFAAIGEGAKSLLHDILPEGKFKDEVAEKPKVEEPKTDGVEEKNKVVDPKTDSKSLDIKSGKTEGKASEAQPTDTKHEDVPKSEVGSLGRRGSIIEAAEEFIEKSEKTLESVFTAIGGAAQSILHDILPEEKNATPHSEAANDKLPGTQAVISTTASSAGNIQLDASQDLGASIEQKYIEDETIKEKSIKTVEEIKLPEKQTKSTADDDEHKLDKDNLDTEKAAAEVEATKQKDIKLLGAKQGGEVDKPIPVTEDLGKITEKSAIAKDERELKHVSTLGEEEKNAAKEIESDKCLTGNYKENESKVEKDVTEKEKRLSKVEDVQEIKLSKTTIEKEEKETDNKCNLAEDVAQQILFEKYQIPQAEKSSSTKEDKTTEEVPQLKTVPEDKVEGRSLLQEFQRVEDHQKQTSDFSTTEEKPELFSKAKEQEVDDLQISQQDLPKQAKLAVLDESKVSEEYKVDKDVLEKEEKQLEKEADQLSKGYEGLSKLSKSISFEKCKVPDEYRVDKEILEKEEKQIEEEADQLKISYEDVTKLAEATPFDKCKVTDEYKVAKEVLEKEEKQIEEEADHLRRSYEDLSKLTESTLFDKCKVTDEYKVAKEVLEKEEKQIEEEADHLRRSYEDLSKLTGSTLFDKCKVTDEYKVAKEVLEKEEKQIEEEADHLRRSYEDLSKLTESTMFDKCKVTDEYKVAKEVLEKEEKQIEEEADHLRRSYEDLSKLTESTMFDKCKVTDEYKVAKGVLEKEEKQIEKEADHLRQSFDDLSKLAESTSFEKCKVIDEYKIEKEILAKEEKQLEKEADHLRKSFEDLSKLAESTPFDKCNTIDEYKVDKDVMEKEDKHIDDIADELRRSYEDLSKLAESTSFEKCSLQKDKLTGDLPKLPEPVPDDKSKTTEKLGAQKKDLTTLDSKLEDSNKVDHFATTDKPVVEETERRKADLDSESSKLISDISSVGRKEEASLETKADVVVDNKPLSSQTEKCEKESMEKPCGSQESSALRVDQPEGKKLSISDVEISIKTDVDRKEASQTFLDNERSIICDSTDAKVYIAPVEGPAGQDGASITAKKTSPDVGAPSDKHSPEMDRSGKTTPPTVPISPVAKELKSPSSKPDSGLSEQTETDEEDLSTKSQVALSQSDLDELDMKLDPMSTSFYGALPQEEDEEQFSGTYLYEMTKAKFSGADPQAVGKLQEAQMSLMTASCIGGLPSESEESKSSEDSKRDPVDSWGKPLGLPAPSYLYEVTQARYHSLPKEADLMTQSFIGEELPGQATGQETSDPMTTSVYFGETSEGTFDPIASWGKPLGLPSPAPPNNNEKGTPKREKKLPAYVTAKNKMNDDKKRPESPSKLKQKKSNAVYVDLSYVPHHGNHYYSYVDFFKRVRARYYVFSGLEPSRQVYDALLEAKQTWEDKELDVTIIPTYDTDILGYWVAENEESLSKYKIDLAPSASRCTINLQDHETSCSAYRLEF